jgi:hypothetical protein
VTEAVRVGDRVRILLDSAFWGRAGWFEGTVVSIEPYSAHRSFYWVQLDDEAALRLGGKPGLISVLNPNKIQKLE